ncbi:conserved hypothetical protein [delta proteobacterium NaphS2]|nr:conserved hypothetical protein [delta proteobacterium NaphS2]
MVTQNEGRKPFFNSPNHSLNEAYGIILKTNRSDLIIIRPLYHS